jgi:hypothetical protein
MTTDDEAATSHRPAEPTTRRDVRGIVAVIVLSLTAVLTAWCGFEASKWGGEMSIAFSEASSARVQASNFDGQARDARQFDLTVYASWVEANARGDASLADYIRARFSPEFTVAFDAWQAEGMADRGPFARAEYVPPGTEEAQEWSQRADERFDQALVNNQRGDDYALLTVLFALVLFLTAMGQRAPQAWASRALLILAGVAGVVAVVIMLTFPVKV